MTYDNRNRAPSVAGVFGQTVSYGYDLAGNRTSIGLGGSNYASYSYDGVNRLNTITDSGSLAINYGYDATNKLTSRTLPNGITTAYDYDGLNRLTRLRHTTATATFTDNQYNYDPANRISQLTDLGGVHAYSYDSVDRLASATYPGATAESYTYDGVGNRTTSHLSASYTYQPFNEVTNAGGVTYTYDNNGNLLTKIAGTATTQYAWDFENRLTQVTLPSGTVVNYKYDALGRRIQRTTSNGGDERYVYDGRNVVQDLDSSSAVVNSYLNGPGLDNHLRQTNATTGASYFLTDHLGSTVGLTDSSANLVEQISYDSFGNHVGSSRTRYTYTGRERDADTGLMYYRARTYDPQLGRFISSDPIGLNGGINPYAYGLNNPTRFVDPSGLDIWDSVLGAVAEHYLGDERVVIGGLAISGHVAAGFGDSITGGLFDMAVHQALPGMPPPSSLGWTPTGAIRNLTPGGNQIDSCSGWYKVGQGGAVVWSLAMMGAGVASAAAESGPAASLIESETAGAANASGLAGRAAEIHGALDPRAAEFRTTAVLSTEEGVDVIAGGGRDLIPAQRALLSPSEVAARLPGAHAEITALNYASSNSLTPSSMAVTRIICPQCTIAIQESGGILTTPKTAIWPR